MFDWVTWSIWLIGFVILVIWIIFPLKEFSRIVREQHAAYKARIAGGEDDAAAEEDSNDA